MTENYRELLEHSFTMEQLTFECGSRSRLEYLSEHIFDFTTYDGEMSELFASKAVAVCAAISDGRTFDYIKDPEEHRWYLLMVNMPFFAGRLDWGGSIRGAWWGHDQPDLDSCGLFRGEEQVTLWQFTRDEWVGFVSAVVDFAHERREFTTTHRRTLDNLNS